MNIVLLLLVITIIFLIFNTVLDLKLYLLFAEEVRNANRFMERLKIKEFHEGDGK